MLGEDLHEGRPTTSMKKGWLCRTSYDEIVHTWWWPVEIQIELWSRSSYDDSERSRSSDDPNPVQWWWSRSSDDPDPVMMYYDDPDREMIQIHMNWRWRWLEDEDDPIDAEKKTSAEKLCRKNTFLVNRECWCICNFGMYSSMYLLCIVTRCLFRDVSIMYLSHVVMPPCSDRED